MNLTTRIVITGALLLWLISLPGCSSPQAIAINQTLPELPAYPERPALTWQASSAQVGLDINQAIQLRDWLILEDAWRQSVREIWGINNPIVEAENSDY